jgi:hypothetical protein
MNTIKYTVAILLASWVQTASAQLTCNAYIKTGCVALSLDISNQTGEESLVSIRINDTTDKSLWSTEVRIAKDAARVVTAQVPRNTKVRWQYSPVSLDNRFDLSSRDVHDSGEPQTIVEVLRPIKRYDDAEARQTFSSLASTLGLNGKQFTSEDAAREFGTVWIKNASNTRLSQWNIRQVAIDSAAKQTYKRKVNVQGSTVSAVSANVPLFTSIAGGLEQNHLYLLQWDIVYHPFTNNQLATNMFDGVKSDTLKAVLAGLSADAGAALCYFSSGQVIKSLLYSVTKGRKNNASGSLSYSTVFTANSSYVFDAQDAETTNNTDLVTLVVESCIPRDSAVQQLTGAIAKAP